MTAPERTVVVSPDDAEAPALATEEPAGEAVESARFEDPYWDDAFCAWWDPTLRTCCG